MIKSPFKTHKTTPTCRTYEHPCTNNIQMKILEGQPSSCIPKIRGRDVIPHLLLPPHLHNLPSGKKLHYLAFYLGSSNSRCDPKG